MIEVISMCIKGFESNQLGLITKHLDDDCFLLDSKALPFLGKAKIVKYVEDIHSKINVTNFSLLNSVKDSDSTILISWAFRGTNKADDSPIQMFGTSVVQFDLNKKIKHIKNATINA